MRKVGCFLTVRLQASGYRLQVFSGNGDERREAMVATSAAGVTEKGFKEFAW
jgi:hypothetical protein